MKAEQLKHDLVITRIFDAPRTALWKAWTEANRLARWWGPQGFTNPVCKLDVRTGGEIRIDMRAPDGTVYPMTGIYREIVEPDHIVFTSYALDATGKPMFEVLNTVTFAEQGGKTTQTVKVLVVSKTALAERYLAGMEAGWAQSLVRLDALLR